MTTASTSPALGSTGLLERLEKAVSRTGCAEVDVELLKELHSTLETEADKLLGATKDLDNTLFSDPFPLLNLLLPLLSHSPSALPATDIARSSLLLVATHSSGKEIAVAVGEKVDELQAPAEDSDEEDQWEDEEPESGGHDGKAPWDPRDAAVRLAVLVEMYTLALPRIKTARPLKLLTPALESLLPAILDLILEGAFREPGADIPPAAPSPADGSEDAASDALALRLFSAVAGLIETIVEGSWLETVDEDFRPMGRVLLSSLLEDSTGLLHPFLPSSNLASSFFYSRFPRLRPPPGRTRAGGAGATAETEVVEQLWKRIDALLQPLKIPIPSLPTLTASRLSTTPSRIGAFTLLVHHLALSSAASSPPFSSPLGKSPGELISTTLSVLKMPFESAMNRVGEDERLCWMWWCVERQVEEGNGAGFEEEALFPLVELVSTLASLSPSPQTRYLSFRLLSRLILRCVPSSSPTSSSSSSSGSDQRDTIQMMLLKSLVSEEETPFEQLRVASVGLVKEVVGEKLREADEASPDSQTPPSLFLTPLFLSEFSSPLFTLPFSLSPSASFSSSSTASPKGLNAEEFVEQHYPATMERLGLYFFLLKRDRRNLTGISSPSHLLQHEASLLAPLRSQLDAWLATPMSADKTPGLQLQVEVVRDMVGRVDEAVEEAKKRVGA
ncbi:hypothetical protein JCM6882_001661 [Rhodosporidiobolus microsporus]